MRSGLDEWVERLAAVRARWAAGTARAGFAALGIAFGGHGLTGTAAGQSPTPVPPAVSTPDRVETRFGTFEYRDGAPSQGTADRAYDALDLMHGVAAFTGAFAGASMYAIREGFLGQDVQDNSIVIFSELMDSRSLFLTANADTVYFLSFIDLSNGPMVLQAPPRALGTIDDMWFRWVTDFGFPGPDRGEGGRYLILPPGYDGPVPEGGYFVARARTNRVAMLGRAFLENNDPQPAVRSIREHTRIYPYTPGAYGTSIAQILTGSVRSGEITPPPQQRFVEGTGVPFQTIPANDIASDRREPRHGRDSMAGCSNTGETQTAPIHGAVWTTAMIKSGSRQREARRGAGRAG